MRTIIFSEFIRYIIQVQLLLLPVKINLLFFPIPLFKLTTAPQKSFSNKYHKIIVIEISTSLNLLGKGCECSLPSSQSYLRWTRCTGVQECPSSSVTAHGISSPSVAHASSHVAQPNLLEERNVIPLQFLFYFFNGLPRQKPHKSSMFLGEWSLEWHRHKAAQWSRKRHFLNMS